MNYWVTTQFPARLDYPKNSPIEGVYVPDGRELAVVDMEVGDVVFVHESRTGRVETRRLLNGTTYSIGCHPGREGVVAIIKITSHVFEIEGTEPTEYADGSQVWWRYMAESETLNTKGFVPRKSLNEILGYKGSYSLHGFGDYHSGIKRIEETHAQAILRAFIATHPTLTGLKLTDRPTQKRNGDRASGGEGPVHKALKNSVANDPVAALGESGLVTVAVEHEFITGDRVDILLQDHFGKLVVVEIEPACSEGDHVGTAQCVKYRALTAFESERDAKEIRAFLVATQIHKSVSDKAKETGVETFEIDSK